MTCTGMSAYWIFFKHEAVPLSIFAQAVPAAACTARLLRQLLQFSTFAVPGELLSADAGCRLLNLKPCGHDELLNP